MSCASSLSLSTRSVVTFIAFICCIFLIENVSCMSLDRLGIERNELLTDNVEDFNPINTAVLVDDMELEAVPSVGNTYMLVPAGSASERESVEKNIIESVSGGEEEFFNPNENAGDMLMMETNDAPAVQVVELPANIAAAIAEEQVQKENEFPNVENESVVEPVVMEELQETSEPIALVMTDTSKQEANTNELENKNVAEIAEIVQKLDELPKETIELIAEMPNTNKVETIIVEKEPENIANVESILDEGLDSAPVEIIALQENTSENLNTPINTLETAEISDSNSQEQIKSEIQTPVELELNSESTENSETHEESKTELDTAAVIETEAGEPEVLSEEIILNLPVESVAENEMKDKIEENIKNEKIEGVETDTAKAEGQTIIDIEEEEEMKNIEELAQVIQDVEKEIDTALENEEKLENESLSNETKFEVPSVETAETIEEKPKETEENKELNTDSNVEIENKVEGGNETVEKTETEEVNNTMEKSETEEKNETMEKVKTEEKTVEMEETNETADKNETQEKSETEEKTETEDKVETVEENKLNMDEPKEIENVANESDYEPASMQVEAVDKQHTVEEHADKIQGENLKENMEDDKLKAEELLNTEDNKSESQQTENTFETLQNTKTEDNIKLEAIDEATDEMQNESATLVVEPVVQQQNKIEEADVDKVKPEEAALILEPEDKIAQTMQNTAEIEQSMLEMVSNENDHVEENKVKEEEPEKEEIKAEEIKKEEFKEDEMKEEIKEDEIKEEIKEDEIREEIKEDEIKEDEIKEDEIKEEEIKDEAVKETVEPEVDVPTNQELERIEISPELKPNAEMEPIVENEVEAEKMKIESTPLAVENLEAYIEQQDISAPDNQQPAQVADMQLDINSSGQQVDNKKSEEILEQSMEEVLTEKETEKEIEKIAEENNKADVTQMQEENVDAEMSDISIAQNNNVENIEIIDNTDTIQNEENTESMQETQSSDMNEPTSMLTTIIQVPQQESELVQQQQMQAQVSQEEPTQPLQNVVAELTTTKLENEMETASTQQTQPQPAADAAAAAADATIESSSQAPLNVMDSVLNYVNASFMQQNNNKQQQQLQELQNSDEIFNSKLRRYDGAQVWRIVVQNDYDKKMADELQTKYDGQLWKEVKQEVDYLLKPQVLAEAEKHIRAANLSRIVLIDNLQKVIEVENPPADEIAQLQNRKGHRLTWQAYHRLDDIHDFFDYLAKTYPDICSVENIGYSIQKRPLKVLKISNGNPGNPGVWIDGGMHAREWISPAAVTYIANQIVEGWDDMPAHMKNVNWYIHAVANPDGYEYSHTTDRLWRKNMRSHGRNCPGVDLNRNFGYKWGGKGTSANPCSQTYRGSKAFSEPETFYISKYISNFPRNTFQAYLSFHSYGQYILYPWGYDYRVTNDKSDLDRVARQAGTTITKSTGFKYTVGSSATTLYPAAGGSDDWAKGFAGIKYAYTIEMGDTGRYGFILPASYIEQNGKDGFTFVSTVARAVTKTKDSRRRKIRRHS